MEEGFKDKIFNKYFIFSIAGLIVFISLAAALPFKDRLFSLLYPKPPSFAAQEAGWKHYDELVTKGKIKPAEPVIRVHLSYDAQSNPQVSIKNVKKNRGYSQPYPTADKGYLLELLDNKGKVLYSVKFEVPDQIAVDEIIESSSGAKLRGGISKAQKVEFFYILPNYSNATQIKLLDPNKKVIDTKNLTEMPIEENKPDFRSITGDEFLKTPKDKLLNFIAKDAYAASTDNSFVDIVFIGDSYTDINAFRSDVNRLIVTFTSTEPFQSQRGRIAFYTLDTYSLGCSFSSQTGGLIFESCNRDLIYQKVNASGVPYDNIYVIVNRNGGSDSGTAILNGGLAFGSNGTFGPQVFTHEAGHSFGGLLDEYVSYTPTPEKPEIINNMTQVNCYAGNPPATGVADWQQDGVAAGDYRQGCSWPNWYASSQNSLMRIIDGSHPENFYFNNVSRRYLNQKINFYASQSPAPQPIIAPGCNCVYSQDCTDSNSLPGIQTCNGVTTGSNDACVWDSSGACAANCTTCQSNVTPPPPPSCTCSYPQSCTTSSGITGVQTCYGVASGSNGACVWDSSGACNPSCTTCQSSQGAPPPTPGTWQACGSCAVGCGGDNSKSHCFVGTDDLGCQSAYQCQISPDGSCQWNPGGCTNSGGNMTCLECVFTMGRYCEPKTSLITWETPSSNVCSNQWGGYSWGPGERIIQQNLNDCEYLNQGNGGCSGNWGYASVHLDNCICGSSTADTKISFSNTNPQAGQKLTVYAKSFKNYDQGSGGGSGKDPMIVRLAAFDAQGKRIDLGTPARTSTQYVSSYNSGSCSANTWTGSGDGSPWPQRMYEWDVTLPTASTYSFQLSVQELFYVCATASLSVAPAPTPAPAAPKITQNVSCVNGSYYNANEVAISWSNPSGAPVGWADISPNIYFNNFWNKSVSGLTSTTAPAGFNSNPSLLPNVPYYVRLYNGTHSPITSFVVFSCPDTQAPTAPSNLTATVVSSSQINLSWSPSTDNTGVTGYDIYRNNTKIATISTTSFGDTGLAQNASYSYYVKAQDGAGNVSAASNTASATTLNAALGYIKGTVYSSAGGVVTGAKIVTNVSGKNKTYYSNAAGAYSIYAVPAGSYTLNFSAKNYRSRSVAVTASGGLITLSNVTLTKR